MVLNGEEGLECKVHVDEIYLEQFSAQMGQNAVGR